MRVIAHFKSDGLSEISHWAVERGENTLNKNGLLVNHNKPCSNPLKHCMNLSPPPPLFFFRLKNAVISGNNFRVNRYRSNVIASVIMIQQITRLISSWTENIICRDYRPVVPPACWNWAVWQFRWSTDGQMDGQKDSEWEGKPPTTWFNPWWEKKQKTSDPAVLTARM